MANVQRKGMDGKRKERKTRKRTNIYMKKDEYGKNRRRECI